MTLSSAVNLFKYFALNLYMTLSSAVNLFKYCIIVYRQGDRTIGSDEMPIRNTTTTTEPLVLKSMVRVKHIDVDLQSIEPHNQKKRNGITQTESSQTCRKTFANSLDQDQARHSVKA